MDMKYYVMFDGDCPEEFKRCSVEVIHETDDKLWCMACEYMHVFDEFEYNDETQEYENAVEKIDRYGIKGNYFNNKYYIPESYINETDWILRYEDNNVYEVPKEDGIYYVKELNANIKVEYEEDFGWIIVP